MFGFFGAKVLLSLFCQNFPGTVGCKVTRPERAAAIRRGISINPRSIRVKAPGNPGANVVLRYTNGAYFSCADIEVSEFQDNLDVQNRFELKDKLLCGPTLAPFPVLYQPNSSSGGDANIRQIEYTGASGGLH